ncbi:MAG: protein-L-isoaspartate O-methyltransferase, partial [bacterium]
MSELEKNIELKSGDTPEHLEFRKKMIKGQIIARGVRDSTVLKAMVRVPRHRFVHEGIEGSAHEDAPLPIGENQTISQP